MKKTFSGNIFCNSFLAVVLMLGLLVLASCKAGEAYEINQMFLSSALTEEAPAVDESQLTGEYNEEERIEEMRSAGAQLKKALEAADIDEPVITVNDITITKKTLELQKALATTSGNVSIRRELIQLVRDKVAQSEAERLGIEPSQESVDQYIQMNTEVLKNKVPGSELMLAYIDGLDITIEEYFEEQKDGIYSLLQRVAFRESLPEDENYDELVDELIKKADIEILDPQLLEFLK